MPIISTSQIRKDFSNKNILDGLSFLIEEKDKIGLIGNNGSGKTTLMKILIGALDKDSGDIYIQKDVKIGYLEQTPTFALDNVYDEMMSSFSELIEIEKKLKEIELALSSKAVDNLDSLLKEYSHLQEIYESKQGYAKESLVNGMIKGLGFSEEQKNQDPKMLSGGEKSRLLLGKLLLSKPDILFLDEPTNHLDLEGISFLEKYLKDYSGTLVLISHDRYFLDAIVNKIFLLEDGKIQIYRGNYSKFYEQRKKDLEMKKHQYDNQQKEIKRQEEIIKRFKAYGNARYIKQGESRQKLLDKMKRIDPIAEKEAAKISFKVDMETGYRVLSCEQVAKSYSTQIFENISFEIFKKDRIGLIGPNGIGKSTLFKIIMKKIQADRGVLSYGSNLRIAYFDQELSNLNSNSTIIDELWDSYPKLNHYQVRSYLAKFNFIGDDIFKLVGDLSGGERARLSLLKLMLEGGNFILLDEPTNHLDIDSKEALEDALLDYEGTILAISHDRYFLNKIANKIFAMSSKGLDSYLGNYDYYLEKTSLKDDEDENDLPISKTEKEKIKRQEREDRQKIKKKKAELEALENKIHKLEENLKKLDEKLQDPSTYEDYELVNSISKDRNNLSKELDDLMEEWMNLG